MFSVFLFVALIFGRTVLVESSAVLSQDEGLTTSTVLGIVVNGGSGNGVDIFAKDADTASATPVEQIATGSITVGTPFASTTALAPATEYDVYIKPDSGSLLPATKVVMETKPDAPVVSRQAGASTSVTYQVTNWVAATYKSISVAVDSEAAKEFTSEDFELTGLTPSTAYSIDITGTVSGAKYASAATTEKLCTAPNYPAITTTFESDTLTVTLDFGTGDKVSEITIFLGIDVASYASGNCDEIVCTDCAACTYTGANDALTLVTSDTSDDLKFSVILASYPNANLEPDFKVSAKYDPSSENCDSANIVESMASLVNREAILVYLAIGTMATVLRLLGLEVWTPVNFH